MTKRSDLTIGAFVRCMLFGILVAGPCSALAQPSIQSDGGRAENLAKMLPRVASFDTGTMTLAQIAEAAAPYLWPTHTELFMPQGIPVRLASAPQTFEARAEVTGHRYYYSIQEIAVASAGLKAAARTAALDAPLPAGVTGVKVTSPRI